MKLILCDFSRGQPKNKFMNCVKDVISKKGVGAKMTTERGL